MSYKNTQLGQLEYTINSARLQFERGMQDLERAERIIKEITLSPAPALISSKRGDAL